MDSMTCFEDVELNLLKGQGLAASSYKTYMVAVRKLYEHTKGLNPLTKFAQPTSKTSTIPS